MKILYLFIISFYTLFLCKEVISSDVYNSKFFDIDVKTLNASEAKINSINDVKYISLIQLADKILDNKSREEFNIIIEKDISSDQLIKNIIIENEIITNQKYIAKIKINLNKEKIINLFRNYKINYTDIQSEPFLVISSYNIDFVNIGLDKKKSFNNYLEHKINKKKGLVNYFFPNLDANDRFILPYEDIIIENKKAFDLILNKYNLNQLIFIKIIKSNINKISIKIFVYDKKNFVKIGNLHISDTNFKSSDDLFEHMSDKIIHYIDDWWKKKYQINISKFNIMECKILTKNFNDLIKIKSDISNLSQVKFVNTKKIQLNNNIIELYYYGDLNIFLKSLSLFNNYYKNINGCIISNEKL